MTKQNNNNIWTLTQALDLIESIWEPLKNVGYGCALTGSVLKNKISENDLDIIIFPQTTAYQDHNGVRKELEYAGLSLKCSRATVSKVWEKHGSTDSKHVEKWQTKDGKIIDFFFLS